MNIKNVLLVSLLFVVSGLAYCDQNSIVDELKQKYEAAEKVYLDSPVYQEIQEKNKLFSEIATRKHVYCDKEVYWSDIFFGNIVFWDAANANICSDLGNILKAMQTNMDYVKASSQEFINLSDAEKNLKSASNEEIERQ